MKIIFKAARAFACLALLISCSDGTQTTVSAPVAFTLRFHASLGEDLADVSCDTPLTNLGSSKASGSLLDLAFFVQGLQFVKTDGSTVTAVLDESEWQSRNVALLDFQDRSDSCSGDPKPTNRSIKGRIDDGSEIRSVRFLLGMPDALNHVDPSSVEAPLNAANMFWSWQGGYKALRVDISPEGGITRPEDPNFLGTNYFLHLGKTDCVGDPVAGEAVSCGRRNNPEILLNDFQLNSSEIILDLQKLMAGLDLNIDEAETPGCMSSPLDTECAAFFESLGMDLTSGESGSGSSQKVFRLR